MLRWLLSVLITFFSMHYVYGQETASREPLYKIVFLDQWEESRNREKLQLRQSEAPFIELAKREQLAYLTHTLPEGRSYVILELDPKKLQGHLVSEGLGKGAKRSYHLYDGAIPMEAVVSHTPVGVNKKI